MNNINKFKTRSFLAYMMTALLGYINPASGAGPIPNPDIDLILDKGLVCPDFALHIVGSGGKMVFKEFVDQNDNPVRLLYAGTGFNLLYESLDDAGRVIGTFSTKSNGAVTKIIYNADGSRTYKIMGHNVLFLFSTDVPPGPSTTLYVGRVVYRVDSSGVFTVQEASGNTTDICAAVSQ